TVPDPSHDTESFCEPGTVLYWIRNRPGIEILYARIYIIQELFIIQQQPRTIY
ncbi:6462_t:CDS:1, partial [Cetraspora pellucida]